MVLSVRKERKTSKEQRFSVPFGGHGTGQGDSWFRSERLKLGSEELAKTPGLQLGICMGSAEVHCLHDLMLLIIIVSETRCHGNQGTLIPFPYLKDDAPSVSKPLLCWMGDSHCTKGTETSFCQHLPSPNTQLRADLQKHPHAGGYPSAFSPTSMGQKTLWVWTFSPLLASASLMPPLPDFTSWSDSQGDFYCACWPGSCSIHF